MDKVIINKKMVQEKFFLDYINFLEGIKTHCKAMHWGIIHIADITNKQSAHIYLDELLDIISDYQDMIAETTQGAIGNYITINNIKGKSIPIEEVASTPHNLCQYLLNNVFTFYESSEVNSSYFAGIKSETETFIKNIQKYNYLFSLCM